MTKVIEFKKKETNRKKRKQTVNNSNHETIQVNKDDYIYMLMDLDDARMDIEGYQNLLSFFIKYKGLHNEFHEFLTEIEKDEDTTLSNMYFGDLEQYRREFLY